MKTKSNINREQWLANAVGVMTPWFKSKGYTVPKVRVSCSWPSSRGLGKTKRTIGECWAAHASEDKVPQIFISPVLREPTESCGVLPTLVHEVVHAVVGNKESHNKVFGKAARAVGLAGKLTQTHAGDELVAEMRTWVKTLGEYPHALIKPGFRPTKKQTTRLVKCECGECGYNVRVTRKWLEQGAPLCPCNQEPMKFELPKELESDDE